MELKHIWEIKHPYYCSVGNFFKNGLHEIHQSWKAYVEDWDGYDIDQNIIWRWDAKLNDDGESFNLTIFRILQRKAYNSSQEILNIPLELEKDVKDYLANHWNTVKKIW